jgi:hypothetical protein
VNSRNLRSFLMPGGTYRRESSRCSVCLRSLWRASAGAINIMVGQYEKYSIAATDWPGSTCGGTEAQGGNCLLTTNPIGSLNYKSSPKSFMRSFTRIISFSIFMNMSEYFRSMQFLFIILNDRIKSFYCDPLLRLHRAFARLVHL